MMLDSEKPDVIQGSLKLHPDLEFTSIQEKLFNF
jgi:hypothetical protein